MKETTPGTTSITTTTTADGTAGRGHEPRSTKMKLTRKAIPFAAALTLMGLLPTVAAQAQGRYGDYDRRGGYADRYDYGRGNRAELARQLAREADRLRREAWSVNRRPNPPVARLLASLDRLDDQAERFARIANDRRYNRYDGYGRYDGYDRYDRNDRNGRYDRYGRGDRYDRRDELNDLLDAYDQVQDAVSDIRPQRYLAEGLARIDSLVDQLTGGYNRYGSYRRGY
jgi:hypothetical protein